MDYGFYGDSRLYLGAVPDSDARAKIARLGGVLKRAHRFAGRPIQPDRLHVSLLFLGSPSEDLDRKSVV